MNVIRVGYEEKFRSEEKKSSQIHSTSNWDDYLMDSRVQQSEKNYLRHFTGREQMEENVSESDFDQGDKNMKIAMIKNST